MVGLNIRYLFSKTYWLWHTVSAAAACQRSTKAELSCELRPLMRTTAHMPRFSPMRTDVGKTGVANFSSMNSVKPCLSYNSVGLYEKLSAFVTLWTVTGTASPPLTTMPRLSPFMRPGLHANSESPYSKTSARQAVFVPLNVGAGSQGDRAGRGACCCTLGA
eukprot:7161646-Prymnesium_polylepis.2